MLRMPKIIIFICVIALGGVFAFWDMASSPQTQPVSLQPAPDASFQDTNGKRYTLQQFKGKVIILNFWATWCMPCIVEFPQLLELAKRQQDHVVFVALSVDENPEDIGVFFKKLPEETQKNLALGNVVIGLDPDKHISKNLFGTTMYPETYIIDEDMMIRRKIRGVTDWLAPAFIRSIL